MADTPTRLQRPDDEGATIAGGSPGSSADAETVIGGDVEIPGYRCLRLLAQGGMGRVYLARHEALGREVALKLVRDEFANDPEIAERFLREARVLARLRHPGVVTVFDAGEADGRLYLATEYVAGGDLAARVARTGPLPEDETLRIGIAIGEALAALHAAGVVHRDVKPENILLDDGRPKLADMGLARAASGEDRVTVTGAPLGTPAFMAPEQADGRPEVDARVDVYALGATLYTLLVGEPPFTGATPWAVVAQILTAPAPDLRARRPDCSPALAELIGDCLSKEPARRPSGAEDLVARLRAVAAGAPTRAVGERRASRAPPALGKPLLIGAGVLALFGLGLLMAVFDGGDQVGAERRGAAATAPASIPDWAAASGRDGHGTWADLAVAGERYRLRWCPPGRYLMGSPSAEAGHQSDERQREVVIAQGYWMGATEVPQRLWTAVMDGNPSHARQPDHPVEGVSWEAAQTFLAALREHSDAPLRLPSEAEWEYAARAGGEGPFGGWDDPAQAWVDRPPEAGHRRVDAGRPNVWGLYAMLGNVAEWCRAEDAEGAVDGRPVRGGAWFTAAQRARVAARRSMPADFAAKHLGLRLVIAAGSAGASE